MVTETIRQPKRYSILPMGKISSTLIKYVPIYKNGPWKMKFFDVEEFFSNNYYFQNGCKNELNVYNEKSCSWSRKRVSHKIDFKAVWPRNSHADSVVVKVNIRWRPYVVASVVAVWVGWDRTWNKLRWCSSLNNVLR